jgi:hypothetical protein
MEPTRNAFFSLRVPETERGSGDAKAVPQANSWKNNGTIILFFSEQKHQRLNGLSRRVQSQRGQSPRRLNRIARILR